VIFARVNKIYLNEFAIFTQIDIIFYLILIVSDRIRLRNQDTKDMFVAPLKQNASNSITKVLA